MAFNPDQPRVPKGSGDPSGEWTSDGRGRGAKAKDNRSGKIRAFHGTPHEFEEFSLEKAGTGEGGAAVAYGINLTSSAKTAAGYAQGGRIYEVEIDVNERDLLDFNLRLSEQSGHVKRALEKVDVKLGEVALVSRSPGVIETKMGRSNRLVEIGGGRWQIEVRAGDRFLAGRRFLSKDAGLAELRRLSGSVGDPIGSQIYDMLGAPRHATRVLRNAGITGARYHAGSTSAGLADPTATNYVIFDASKVKIVGKPPNWPGVRFAADR